MYIGMVYTVAVYNCLTCVVSVCQPSQVFCLSTTKAVVQKEAGYIAEDYSRLLDGIQRLIPIGLQRTVQHSYRSVLRKSLGVTWVVIFCFLTQTGVERAVGHSPHKPRTNAKNVSK